MKVELLVRGRFVDVPEAVAERVGANAFTVRLPLQAAAVRALRRGPDPEAYDGVILSIDGVEAEPALASGGDAAHVTVAVWLLGG